MAEKLKLVIVTPAGEKLAGEADEIVAPGYNGQFGVMPGHIEFFTTNPPGVFKATDGGKESIWAVGKGFIEVSNDEVQLLVQSAEPAEKIDVSRAEAARKRAEESLDKLEGNQSDEDWEHQNLRLQRAVARLEAVGAAK